MTDKLYLQDAYLRDFSATVLETRKTATGWEVVLDRTAFYPEGGGQPSDTGLLGKMIVTAVREENDHLIHAVQNLSLEASVAGRIDWNRRFYHMQQHSGQHILSSIFDEIFQASTVGFHLGAESTQIDIALAELSSEQAAEAEAAANDIIYQNLPLTAHIVQREDLHKFPLRKAPVKEYAQLRIISVGTIDSCPCGGTHVRATGEIGLIKILGWEKKNNCIRVSFVCGERALSDYQQKHHLVQEMTSKLSVPLSELSQALTQRFSKADQLVKELSAARMELKQYQAAALLQSAPAYQGVRLIAHVLQEALPSDAAQLAKNLTESDPVVALIAAVSPGEVKAHLVFATNTDNQDMNTLLKQALSTLNGKGGGSPRLAQGGTNNPNGLQEILNTLLNDVKNNL